MFYISKEGLDMTLKNGTSVTRVRLRLILSLEMESCFLFQAIYQSLSIYLSISILFSLFFLLAIFLQYSVNFEL